MNQTICWSILALALATQIILPAKIHNIQDLQKLAEEGDSNAECLLGLQEMTGGDLYDPSLINTVSLDQILLNKLEKWRDQIRFIPGDEKGSEFELGSKTNDAFRWVEKSAQQGNKIALYCLGIFYLEGMAVKQNSGQAYENFKKSAELGFYRSCVPLKNLSLEKNDTKQALSWIMLGYNAGDVDCKVALGYMLLGGGPGLQKDDKRGFSYIEEGYRAGSKLAIGYLGDCYLNGWGTSKDLSKAFAFFKEGAPINKKCKLRLGQMYLHGESTAKDEQKGIALIEEVASTGGAEAKDYLGRIYANGWGVSVNNEKALVFFKEAASAGYPKAMFALGYAYYEGRIVKKDFQLAIIWLKKAKDRGSEQASELLEKIEAQDSSDPWNAFKRDAGRSNDL
ncbi:MAG: sel1 repeat family protein [Verrucomicrobia bacterium]|nr:sel1 repeat family protein [Microbacteriaceae bacterium]NBS06538.1 sel1 repeat family protein [Verrucomicrobiota bacterium]NBS49177.1 sel1 repeat family protein [Verrucomicrobiota bacterium]NBS78575.1 sel1 repeat family protein [bacterium]